MSGWLKGVRAVGIIVTFGSLAVFLLRFTELDEDFDPRPHHADFAQIGGVVFSIPVSSGS